MEHTPLINVVALKIRNANIFIVLIEWTQCNASFDNQLETSLLHSRGAQGHFNYLAYTAAGCITLIFLYFGRHGVSKAQNQRFHDPSRDMEVHLTAICPVTGYPKHFSCLVCPVTGQIDPAIGKTVSRKFLS